MTDNRWGARLALSEIVPYAGTASAYRLRANTITASWALLEPSEGVYNFDVLTYATGGDVLSLQRDFRHGFRLECNAPWGTQPPDPLWPDASMPPLDMADWTRYIRDLATYFRGTIQFGVCNEAAGTRTWGGTAAEYRALLVATYEAVSEVRPDAITCTDGLSSTNLAFLQAWAKIDAGVPDAEVVAWWQSRLRLYGPEHLIAGQVTDVQQLIDVRNGTGGIRLEEFWAMYIEVLAAYPAIQFQVHLYPEADAPGGYTHTQDAIDFIREQGISNKLTWWEVGLGWERDNPEVPAVDYDYMAEQIAKQLVIMAAEGAEFVILYRFSDAVELDPLRTRIHGLVKLYTEPLGPRPGMAAYLTAYRLLQSAAGGEQVGLGNPLVTAYRFNRGHEGDLLVLWSSAPTTVRLDSGYLGTLTGIDGTTSPSGSRAVAVGASPLFLEQGTYGAIVEGLHERFETVAGIRRIYDYEPATLQATPALYTVLERVERQQGGPLMVSRYRILHRLCLRWQDNEHAEEELIPYVNAIPDALDADPQLGGRITSGIARIAEAEAGFATINGTLYRVLDFYSDVVHKAPVAPRGG